MQELELKEIPIMLVRMLLIKRYPLKERNLWQIIWNRHIVCHETDLS